MNPFLARLLTQQQQLQNAVRGFTPTKFVTPTKAIRGDRTFLSFCSADYLNLGEHQEIKRAAFQELDSVNLSSHGARLSAGTKELHLLAEKRLAQFLGVEDALLMPSRTQACFTLLGLLLTESDTLFFNDTSESPLSDIVHLIGCKSAVLDPLAVLNDTTSSTRNSVRDERELNLAILDSSVNFKPTLASDNSAMSIKLRSNFNFLVFDETYFLASTGIRGAGIHEDLLFVGNDFCLYGDLGASLPCPLAFIAGPNIILDQIRSRSRVTSLESSASSILVKSLVAAIDRVESLCNERISLTKKRDQLFDQLPIGSDLVRVSKLGGAGIQFNFKSSLLATKFYEAALSHSALLDLVNYSGMSSRVSLVRAFINTEHTLAELNQLAEILQVFLSRQAV